jgi:hypothetical protein
MNSVSLHTLLGLSCAAVLAAPAVAQDLTLGELLSGSHVHGLALDPGDANRLYAATHHGLFAVDLLSRRAVDLAGGPTDFMGFSAVPGASGTFLASGHPPEGGNLGVVRSTDGGATWEPLSPGVDGPVDFHQMTISAADPDLVWGVHHGALLQRSRDSGTSWEPVGPAPAGIIDLAASATDPETLYAATERGLMASTDGGASWSAAHPSETPASVVEATPDGRILAFILGQGLVAATEPTLAWETVGTWAEDGVPLHLALDPGNPTRVVVATTESRLLISANGGESWTLIAGPDA